MNIYKILGDAWCEVYKAVTDSYGRLICWEFVYGGSKLHAYYYIERNGRFYDPERDFKEKSHFMP